MVPDTPNYRVAEEYFERKSVEYKPYKAVLRGLFDMELDELKPGLVLVGLEQINVFEIKRKNKEIRYRDQLYLVHLAENTTSLAELRNIRALFNIVVKWER